MPKKKRDESSSSEEDTSNEESDSSEEEEEEEVEERPRTTGEKFIHVTKVGIEELDTLNKKLHPIGNMAPLSFPPVTGDAYADFEESEGHKTQHQIPRADLIPIRRPTVSEFSSHHKTEMKIIDKSKSNVEVNVDIHGEAKDLMQQLRCRSLKFTPFLASFHGVPTLMQSGSSTGDKYAMDIETMKNAFSAPITRGTSEGHRYTSAYTLDRRVIVTGIRIVYANNTFTQPIALKCETYPFLNDQGIILPDRHQSDRKALVLVNPGAQLTSPVTAYNILDVLSNDPDKMVMGSTPLENIMIQQVKLKPGKEENTYLLVPEKIWDESVAKQHERYTKLTPSEAGRLSTSNIYGHLLSKHLQHGFDIKGGYKLYPGKMRIKVPTSIVHKAIIAMSLTSVAEVQPISLEHPITWRIVPIHQKWTEYYDIKFDEDARVSQELVNVKARINQLQSEAAVSGKTSKTAEFLIQVETVPYFGEKEEAIPEETAGANSALAKSEWMRTLKSSLKQEAASAKIPIGTSVPLLGTVHGSERLM